LRASADITLLLNRFTDLWHQAADQNGYGIQLYGPSVPQPVPRAHLYPPDADIAGNKILKPSTRARALIYRVRA